jgi:ABC-type transporter Mla subunit MlaD
MALQDLTPQLRTRLSRMERAVGWFVLLATALLVFGFGYYLHNTAKRKGWFKTRAPYFTFVDRATGLKVGDPVMLMGFEAGRITKVLPQPPEDFSYNVYVEFDIIEPNYGYLWTEGSRTKVVADFLGKRALEVTKGTGGHATYLFHPLREFTLTEAERLGTPEPWLLGADVYDQTETNLVVKALVPLQKEILAQLRQLGCEKFPALDRRERRKSPTVVWNDKQGRYVKFVARSNPRANLQANIYWLPSDEAPAVNERLDKLISQVEKALPNILDLTNKIAAVLANGANLTSNLNAVALQAQPASSNLACIIAQLRTPGALGEWALGTNGQKNLDSVLENVNATVVHTDTNLTALVENLTRSLDNLADMTRNLNAQVQANTNILSSISSAVVDADDLVQGLKRHWLLRSAFKEKRIPQSGTPAELLRLQSPKDGGRP